MTAFSPTVLIIDHYDSFTYNLVQYFQNLGAQVRIEKCDQVAVAVVQKASPDFLVFSPGPGSVYQAKDIGNSERLIAAFVGKIPILGVCLGHQLIGKMFGAQVVAVTPQHGKRWPIRVLDKSGLFKDSPDTFAVMRYHSMIVTKTEAMPPSLKVTALTDDQAAQIMAIEDSAQKLYGVQFHPESIGTPTGLNILKNFLNSSQPSSRDLRSRDGPLNKCLN